MAVFVGCFVAWQFKGMGAADGKLATLMAAIDPATIVLSRLMLVPSFAHQWFRGQRGSALPAAVAYLVGALLMTLLVMVG